MKYARKNEQVDFTAYETFTGDIYIENSEGEERLVLSPSSSEEYAHMAENLMNADNKGLRAEFNNTE